jgi:hypothetical protein
VICYNATAVQRQREIHLSAIADAMDEGFDELVGLLVHTSADTETPETRVGAHNLLRSFCTFNVVRLRTLNDRLDFLLMDRYFGGSNSNGNNNNGIERTCSKFAKFYHTDVDGNELFADITNCNILSSRCDLPQISLKLL